MDVWLFISEVIDILLDGQEKDFIVIEQGDFIGIIFWDDILCGLQEMGLVECIKCIVNIDWVRFLLDMEFNEVYDLMNQCNLSICLVYNFEGDFFGVLNIENIFEVIMIEWACGGQGES